MTAEKAADALVAVRGSDSWMAGQSFSLADLHLAPVIAYLSQAPEGRAMLERRPALAAWWEQAAQRPSIAETRSPLEG